MLKIDGVRRRATAVGVSVVLALIGGLLAPAGAFADDEVPPATPVDTSAPVLVGSSVSGDHFNMEDGPASFVVSIHITDATGVKAPQLLVWHGSGQSVAAGPVTLASGTAQDGIWESTVIIPQGYALGTWTVWLREITDGVGNWTTENTAIETVTLVSATPADTSPPVVVSSSMTPSAVDVYFDDATVVITAHITDEVGVRPPEVYVGHVDAGDMSLSSGTRFDGTWTLQATIPAQTLSGDQPISIVRLKDELGHEADPALVGMLAIDGKSPQDDDPPVLVSASVSETTVDTTTAPATFVVTVHATDATGVSPPYVQMIHDTQPDPEPLALSLVSGSKYNGVYEREITLPQGSAPGPWSVQMLGLRDYSFRQGEPKLLGIVDNGVVPLKPMAATPAVYVNGAPFFGNTVSVAIEGKWSPADVTQTLQWYRSGIAIDGAVGATYLLGQDDIGEQISVAAIASRKYYVTTTETSAQTEPVRAAGLGAGSATVTGTAAVGNALSVTSESWSPASASLSYRWSRSGVVVPGETAGTYELTADDAGKIISVEVTGTLSGYTPASVVAVRWVVIQKGALVAPTPKITGTAKVNKKLTATAGTWGPGAVKLTYRWYRSGVAIKKATAKTYKLVAADRKKKITVKVTGSRTGYVTTTAVSKATAKVG